MPRRPAFLIFAISWSTSVLDRLGIPPDLFPPIAVPGSIRGTTSGAIPVVAVGSHDTASAVAAVPATTDRFGYVSCGTWSLVGLELEAPILTEDRATSKLHQRTRRRRSNQIPAQRGRAGCCRNVCVIGGRMTGLRCSRRQLVWGGAVPVIDPDDPMFVVPGDMPTRISEAVLGPDGRMEPPVIVRCILDSLAGAFAGALAQGLRAGPQKARRGPYGRWRLSKWPSLPTDRLCWIRSWPDRPRRRLSATSSSRPRALARCRHPSMLREPASRPR